MKVLDLTFPTPEENLACDEGLLDLCEDGFGEETLRFWEPRDYFIVLGYSSKTHSEIDVNSCRENRIPVFRRISGGCAVLQGPGCLNFSLILKSTRSSLLRHITKTNRYVLECHQKAFENILSKRIDIQGHSDLTFEGLKFSGNSQRRKRHFLLFHGCFLLGLDIPLMEKLLPIPKRQPDYRQNRSHSNFLTNLNVPSVEIKQELKKSWHATEIFQEVPEAVIASLVRNKYSKESWNFKF
jgi:lipoate-protein ligase A